MYPQSSPRRCVSPGPGDKLRKLEERLRLGEKEALMAEERARLKQSVMSQKMAEMTKLENTLTDQNQVSACRTRQNTACSQRPESGQCM